ncbi:PALE chloroplastic isoform B [Chlorella sorokiniana]|uniref:PALE chloroplastic isoform A n=1 Tax=Chlorella sorokiniana TaxID=3076 RepID=A0A2P6U572_CHLSO|nr:PALE chloroplastic isoform A [Chlorella sorokiniana]PRW61468.1 PALE chloroplastic isoform B [Chlorella sorokiniana]|eukprot:PRW61467.1 PALE chloroplastic isoform A [Chlorella sorokiniana]
MAFWAASRPLRLAVVARAADGGNTSRRRSQRLNQQGRTRQQGRNLEEQLREREARAAEQQRLQDQDELGLLPALEEEEQGEGEEEGGPSRQDQAMRDLVGKLRQWPPGEQEREPPADEASVEGNAAAGGVLGAELAGEAVGEDSEEEELPELPPIDVVEADYIFEEQTGQPPAAPGTPPPAPSRQATALLAIMQAGEAVEEVIAQHREDIDEEMLRLLDRRMQAAEQLEPELQEDVLEGLQLLHRRLKAEIDRQRAPPSLRLLDELLNILDPAGAGLTPTQAEREQRRRQAAVRLRAAFAGGITAEADVLSLAAQLGSSGGSQLADQLVADPVDPTQFMAECTELLAAAQEQQRQVAAYLQRLPEVPGGEDEEAAGRAAAQRAHLEGLLQERQAAAAMVEEVLELAQAVSRRLSGL